MSTYEYKGFDPSGQTARGLVEALDLKEAREKLLRRGVLPETLHAAGQSRRLPWRRKDIRFTLDARTAFYRELSSMLNAGIPLNQALALLMDAPEMGEDRPVIAGIRDRIAEGQSLERAVEQASPGVTPFELAIVRTGERAGLLDRVLDRLADFLEEERAIQDRLVGAMVYPAIIIGLSVLVAGVMWFFLLPSFRELLLESGVELPWITRALMGSARVLSWLLPLGVLLCIGGGWYGRRKWRTSDAFRVAVDRRLHAAPFFRSFYPVLAALRYARTLAMLLHSRLPLLDALGQAARASGSPYIISAMDREIEHIRHGEALSDALARIPPLAGSLPGWVRAGEASGEVASMLEHAAARLQHVWNRRVTRSLALLESGLIVLVGLAVFILALSIVQPILSLNQALQ